MKSRIKLTSAMGGLLLLLTCCDPTIESVGKMTDQDELAKIASQMSVSDIVRLAAMKKITDQNILEKLATEGEPFVRSAAVHQLSDQAVLERIATGDRKPYSLGNLQIDALEGITDQAVLAAVAMKAKERDVRVAALLRLADPKYLDSRTASILSRTRASCQTLPSDHKQRLTERVLEMLFGLMNPVVERELGEVQSFTTSWAPFGANYILTPARTKEEGEPRYYDIGEEFKVSVKLSKCAQTIVHTWETKLPGSNPSHHRYEARIQSEDILGDAYHYLAQDTLISIAVQSEWTDFRIAAVRNIVNQAALCRIVFEDKEEEVQMAALEQITDMGVIKKIFNEHKGDAHVMAAEKLGLPAPAPAPAPVLPDEGISR